jgi:hypothetical protein
MIDYDSGEIVGDDSCEGEFPPMRSLFFCPHCGGQFIQTNGKWVPRADWTYAEDQRLFDELTAKEPS